MAHRGASYLRAFAVLLLATAASGCSFAYTDKAGDQHVIGLVDYTVRAPAAPETVAGNVIEVTSVGLSLGHNAQGAYVTAGYNKQTTAALRDSAAVLGNPLAALAATGPQEGNPPQ